MFEESTYEFDNGFFFDPNESDAVLIVLGYNEAIVFSTVVHGRVFHVVLVSCLEFKHGCVMIVVYDGGLLR